MDPDFARLEFARFNPKEDDVADQNAPQAQAPAKPAGRWPWIGNLFGAVSFDSPEPAAAQAPASSPRDTTSGPASLASDPAKAVTTVPAGKGTAKPFQPVTVHVHTGAGPKAGKKAPKKEAETQ